LPKYRSTCSVLLMCHSFADEARQRLSNEFRRYCPEGRIIGVSNIAWPQARKEVDFYVFGLEGPDFLSEAQSKRIAASLFNLPTAALRREYRAMSDTDARWAKVIRQQAEVLRDIYSAKDGRVQRNNRSRKLRS